MKSTAEAVRHRVARKPLSSFVSPGEFSGSPHAVECALSRMAAEGDLARVRHGLYWKGPRSRFGMTPPHPLDVALHLAGPGSGPAGFSAAAALGLTTQVPATIEVAVPGRPPVAPSGIRFAARHQSRRDLRLSADEVALLEVLSDWPVTTECSWEDFGERVKELIGAGAVRPTRVAKEVAQSRRPAIRQGWARLSEQLDP